MSSNTEVDDQKEIVQIFRLTSKDGGLTFAQIPAMMIVDPMLSALDVRVAGLIIPWLGQREKGWVSIDTMVKAGVAAKSTIKASLVRLYAAGWFESVAANDNKTRRHFVARWKTVDGLRSLRARLRTGRIDDEPTDEPPPAVEHYKRPDYHKYLDSEKWNVLRRKVLKAAGYRCQMCNAATRLQIHHRTYERLGFEKLADLLALCDDCHDLYHKNKPMP